MLRMVIGIPTENTVQKFQTIGQPIMTTFILQSFLNVLVLYWKVKT